MQQRYNKFKLIYDTVKMEGNMENKPAILALTSFTINNS